MTDSQVEDAYVAALTAVERAESDGYGVRDAVAAANALEDELRRRGLYIGETVRLAS